MDLTRISAMLDRGEKIATDNQNPALLTTEEAHDAAVYCFNLVNDLCTDVMLAVGYLAKMNGVTDDEMQASNLLLMQQNEEMVAGEPAAFSEDRPEEDDATS